MILDVSEQATGPGVWLLPWKAASHEQADGGQDRHVARGRRRHPWPFRAARG
jgi:hypothetical protein